MTYGLGCTIQVWDIDTLNIKCILTSNKGNKATLEETADPEFSSPQDICSCAVSPNNVVVGGTGKGIIHIWYGGNWESSKVSKEHKHLITCLEFSPNGTHLVSADMKGFIKIWLFSYDEQQELEIH